MERRRVSFEFILALVVTLIGWVYTAGAMSARMANAEQRLDRIEQKVDRLVFLWDDTGPKQK